MSNAPSDPVVNFDIDINQEVRPDDEGLFARDVDGQLIRVEQATADELDKDITMTIDGRQVTVKKAVPECDSQGNIKRDSDGSPVPRPTTIFDAAAEAFVIEPGDEHPIPALCHREHLPPVGVCRVCVVEVAEKKGDDIKKKLVPACKQAVSDGMIVNTFQSEADPDAAAKVKAASRTVVELLMADHLPDSQRGAPANELDKIAKRLDANKDRFSGLACQRGLDDSSQMIMVDHDQCILCGRCQRGCNWIKGNNVIGRGGKGYQSRIVFDLDDPMGPSSCVSCGECAVSCPTGALEFQPKFIKEQVARVQKENEKEREDGANSENYQIVTADELATKYELFSGIPYKFLQFNGAAV
ncbi:MAG: 2Fe-2S iron-sulfur cluster-binding protein, partial [Pirellulales bacterium]|nr:2Fe-2S iron-sulfur cluster-binding protein [Pirellulales bacterium]